MADQKEVCSTKKIFKTINSLFILSPNYLVRLKLYLGVLKKKYGTNLKI